MSDRDEDEPEDDFEDDTDHDLDTLFQRLLIQNQQMCHVMIMAAILLVAQEIVAAGERAEPIPYHTSLLTGPMWVLELMHGHPDRIRHEFGVRKDVFKQLINDLTTFGFTHSRHVFLEEQLGIFLYTCVTGMSCSHVGERFQRSTSTISKYFRRMLVAFSSPGIYTKYVKLPPADTPVPSRIADDTAVFPFFKNAIGAIDGTHIACTPSAAEREATRNRKGFHSQNCLVCCNFNLEFLYVLSGWEGSANDALVFHNARTTNFAVPPGRYYLADAGYPLCPQLMVPFRGIRYHLPEWERARLRPSNAEEYYNLRHAQLRNVVERIIGVVKRRFHILVDPPEFDMSIQARILPALCCIHNVIRRYDPKEIDEEAFGAAAMSEAATGDDDDPADKPDVYYGEMATGFTTANEREAAVAEQREIKESLWNDHVHYVQTHQQ